MTTRPALKARYWIWKDQDRNETPGIALMGRHGLATHMTYAECYALADALVDLCDAAGNPEPPLPTTTAESE